MCILIVAAAIWLIVLSKFVFNEGEASIYNFNFGLIQLTSLRMTNFLIAWPSWTYEWCMKTEGGDWNRQFARIMEI